MQGSLKEQEGGLDAPLPGRPPCSPSHWGTIYLSPGRCQGHHKALPDCSPGTSTSRAGAQSCSRKRNREHALSQFLLPALGLHVLRCGALCLCLGVGDREWVTFMHLYGLSSCNWTP